MTFVREIILVRWLLSR